MKAYTYLIGWSKFDRWYYGIRFAKGCHPDELWIKYFTSSKKVRQFVSEYGKPDIIKIRKLFDDINQARLWEHKVLRRLNVIKKDKWLNLTDNRSISYEKNFRRF